ncbi:MAG TPA: hypothetical protein VFU02_04810, partial [Polyangiaceae bacterium]|nr:hypothetical protein [Polyangiaceae bacterium]
MPARVRIPVGQRGALSGSVPVVTDPDILERALLFAALARGTSECRVAQAPASLAAALQLLTALGVESTEPKAGVHRIQGAGRTGLCGPRDPLDVRGVPVLARGLLGVLAAQPFPSRLGPFEARDALAADLELLRARGAEASVVDGSEAAFGPHTGPLAGQTVTLPQPAPLTKHVVLMAGLYSDQITSVSEPL